MKLYIFRPFSQYLSQKSTFLDHSLFGNHYWSNNLYLCQWFCFESHYVLSYNMYVTRQMPNNRHWHTSSVPESISVPKHGHLCAVPTDSSKYLLALSTNLPFFSISRCTIRQQNRTCSVSSLAFLLLKEFYKRCV